MISSSVSRDITWFNQLGQRGHEGLIFWEHSVGFGKKVLFIHWKILNSTQPVFFCHQTKQFVSVHIVCYVTRKQKHLPIRHSYLHWLSLPLKENLTLNRWFEWNEYNTPGLLNRYLFHVHQITRKLNLLILLANITSTYRVPFSSGKLTDGRRVCLISGTVLTPATLREQKTQDEHIPDRYVL